MDAAGIHDEYASTAEICDLFPPYRDRADAGFFLIGLLYHIRHLDGRFEAEHLLARCGFRVEALYSDYDPSPYGATYPGELIFVAAKTAAAEG